MNHTLRGRIIEQFKTISAFAEAIGWSNRKASYIVNGKQELTARDIESMAELLHVEIPEELRTLFLQ